MKIKLLLSLFGLLCGTSLSAQVALKGLVLSASSGEAIPFVNITLTSQKDTTIVLRGITDLKGGYSFDPVAVGRYHLNIQSVGYQAIDRPIRITLPSVGRTIELTEKLAEDVRALGEVVVQGKASQQYIDHRTMRFDAKSVKEALHSYDLMKTLPGIKVDIVTDQLKGQMGGKVQLLINGVRATDNDVRMLPKDKIKRVELYDIPSARYRNAEVVINIIASGLDDGYVVGGRLEQAIGTGFANGNLYSSLITGKHKLTLEYQLNHRDYDDRESETVYRFLQAGQQAKRSYNEHDSFGYTRHIPALKYAFLKEDRSLWEARLRPNFERRFADRLGKGAFLLNDIEQQSLSTQGRDRTKIINPSLDLYHWRKLGEREELSINAVGTLFSAKRQSATRNIDAIGSALDFEDFMDLDNRRQSLILELAHSKSFSGLSLSSGYRGNLSYLHSRVDNGSGALDDKSREFIHYAYSELAGKYKRLLYRVSLGFTHTTNSSDYRSFKQLSFTPKVMLGYSLGKRSTLRLSYAEFTTHPDINDLSSNRRRQTKELIQVGNPHLETMQTSTVVMRYDYLHRFFELKAIGGWSYARKPFVNTFEPEGNSYLLKPINGDSEQAFLSAFFGTLKPFGDNTLKLDVTLKPTHYRLRSAVLSYTKNFLDTKFTASFKHKGWSLYYTLTLPGYAPSVGYASRIETDHSLQVAYKYKQWRAFATLNFIGAPAYYHNYTLGHPLVQEERKTWIHDNQNMLSLGVSFHFNRGKDKGYKKTLNNQDTAAPVL